MHRFAVLFVLLLTAPALAQEWSTLENKRFGYTVDIPPGFEASGPPPVNGDGQVYASTDGRAELRVWGATVLDGFPAEFDAMVGYAAGEGWEVSIPPDFAANAAYEGRKGNRRIAVHAISYCTGALMAAFQLTYDAEDSATYSPMIAQLSASLDRAQGTVCP